MLCTRKTSKIVDGEKYEEITKERLEKETIFEEKNYFSRKFFMNFFKAPENFASYIGGLMTSDKIEKMIEDVKNGNFTEGFSYFQNFSNLSELYKNISMFEAATQIENAIERIIGLNDYGKNNGLDNNQTFYSCVPDENNNKYILCSKKMVKEVDGKRSVVEVSKERI